MRGCGVTTGAGSRGDELWGPTLLSSTSPTGSFQICSSKCPALPEQGLSGQVTLSGLPGPLGGETLWVTFPPSMRLVFISILGDSPSPHSHPCQHKQPASSEGCCSALRLCLSAWHLCPVCPSGGRTLQRTLGKRIRAEIRPTLCLPTFVVEAAHGMWLHRLPV